jgi:hypothetical protein
MVETLDHPRYLEDIVCLKKKVSTNSVPPSQSHLASLVGGFILAIEAKIMFKTTKQMYEVFK